MEAMSAVQMAAMADLFGKLNPAKDDAHTALDKMLDGDGVTGGKPAFPAIPSPFIVSRDWKNIVDKMAQEVRETGVDPDKIGPYSTPSLVAEVVLPDLYSG